MDVACSAPRLAASEPSITLAAVTAAGKPSGVTENVPKSRDRQSP